MSWGAPPSGEPQQQPHGQPQPQWSQHGRHGSHGGYDGEPGGPYFPQYPPDRPKLRRTSVFTVLGVIAIAVAAGVAAAVAVIGSGSGKGTPAAAGSSSAPPSQSPHTVAVPASAGPLRLLSNADTARRISRIKTSLAGNAAYSNPQIGFYAIGPESSYSVWMLTENTTGISVVQNSVTTLGDEGMARAIARGAKMTDVTAESPGPLGGALLCGKVTLAGSGYRVCAWVDNSTVGWVYFMPSVRQSDVLPYTLDVRNAAEK